MTQLDIISFYSAILFSFEFFIICFFVISVTVLFWYLSYHFFLINKLTFNKFLVYKLSKIWKTIINL